MSGHLVAGYDGSAVSRAAVGWAADEAARRDAALTVIGCYRAPVVTDYGLSTFLSTELPRLRERTEQALGAVVDELRDLHPGQTIGGCVIEGRAAKVLAEQAHHGDLLVVGTTGSSDPSGWFIGSVARTMVRTSPCPVVLVPEPRAFPDRPHVVVAVDGTSRSTAALEWAIDEADRVDGDLTVVHSWRYPYGLAPSEARDLMQVDAAVTLEQAVARARDRGGGVVHGDLREGHPAQEIVAGAADADLLVVGTRAQHLGLRLMAIGSVAERVVEHVRCPVAVVRQPDPD